MGTIVVRESRRGQLVSIETVLTPRQLRVVQLRYVEGMTQAEIAPVVGVSQQQVAKVLAGAIAELRRYPNLLISIPEA